jgi:hypothetical protein
MALGGKSTEGRIAKMLTDYSHRFGLALREQRVERGRGGGLEPWQDVRVGVEREFRDA